MLYDLHIHHSHRTNKSRHCSPRISKNNFIIICYGNSRLKAAGAPVWLWSGCMLCTFNFIQQNGSFVECLSHFFFPVKWFGNFFVVWLKSSPLVWNEETRAPVYSCVCLPLTGCPWWMKSSEMKFVDKDLSVFFKIVLFSFCTDDSSQSQPGEDSSHHDESFVPKSLVDCLRRCCELNVLWSVLLPSTVQ